MNVDYWEGYEVNNSKTKTVMPEQDPNIRNKNFEEVASGYTYEMAINEGDRCLQCKNRPCVSGCPVNVQIPDFIKALREDDPALAGEIIAQTNMLPAVCGRVCPQELQCEKNCVRGIKGEPVGIGRLERFVADWNMQNNDHPIDTLESNGIKVAMIGSGPASLTCAGDLAQKGYEVTVFESLHTPGGVLVYGIPQFRLPKEIVQREVERLSAMGVDIQTNTFIGRTLTIKDLFDNGFKAIFIATGAGLPRFMDIPGKDLLGVYSANEYLTRINLMKAYKKGYDTPLIKSRSVAVIGGGNVAMDSARCAKRMGADNVYVVYRRSEEELPARAEEVHHAKEEGIIFKLLSNPIEVIGDESGYTKAIKCVEMTLGEPDSSGRRRPIKKEDSEFILEVDTVIMAIGTLPNPLINQTTEGLDFNEHGFVTVDEDMATSRKGIFAGGDAVTGSATVILAMGAGKKAAASIDKYLQNLDT